MIRIFLSSDSLFNNYKFNAELQIFSCITLSTLNYNDILDKINKNWLEWLVGFTDAEGCFSIVPLKNRNFRIFFRIRLHKDDIKVLREIADT